jgi:hypothetical protein
MSFGRVEAAVREFRSDGNGSVTPQERDTICRLRAENCELQMRVEVIEKAMASFPAKHRTNLGPCSPKRPVSATHPRRAARFAMVDLRGTSNVGGLLGCTIRHSYRGSDTAINPTCARINDQFGKLRGMGLQASGHPGQHGPRPGYAGR